MLKGTKNNDVGNDNPVRDNTSRDISTGENVVRDALSALSENVRQRARDELLELIRQVEDAVDRGTAQMQDYETFVLCKRELARREVSYVL